MAGWFSLRRSLPREPYYDDAKVRALLTELRGRLDEANRLAARQNELLAKHLALLTDQNGPIYEAVFDLSSLESRFRTFFEKWRDRYGLPPDPTHFTLVLEKEIEGMSDTLQYRAKFPLPWPTGKDVVGGRLIHSVAGGTPQVIEISKGAADFFPVEVPQGSAFETKFAYVDDAGLLSPSPFTIAATGTDTLPPPDPSGFELTLESEVEGDETEPAPADPAPSDPAPADPAPVEPAPSDPAPADPAPVDPVPADPAPADPAPADPAPSDSGETPSEG